MVDEEMGSVLAQNIQDKLKKMCVEDSLLPECEGGCEGRACFYWEGVEIAELIHSHYKYSAPENVCCPMLGVVKCAETKDHKHFYCDAYHTIEQQTITNGWAKIFCIGNFAQCKYFPKGE